MNIVTLKKHINKLKNRLLHKASFLEIIQIAFTETKLKTLLQFSIILNLKFCVGNKNLIILFLYFHNTLYFTNRIIVIVLIYSFSVG